MAERHDNTERVIQFFLTLISCFDSDDEEENMESEQDQPEDEEDAEEDEESDDEGMDQDNTEPWDSGDDFCISDME